MSLSLCVSASFVFFMCVSVCFCLLVSLSFCVIVSLSLCIFVSLCLMSSHIFCIGIMDAFLESIHVGWSSLYGPAIHCAGMEQLQFAIGFTEVELKELLREELDKVGAGPFHVSQSSVPICCDMF